MTIYSMSVALYLAVVVPTLVQAPGFIDSSGLMGISENFLP